jgi:hypothetical protein
LREAYLRYKGDMKKIVNEVYLYSYEDEDRYRHLIEEMIDRKEVPMFKAFSRLESKGTKQRREKKAKKEAAEAEEAARLLGVSNVHEDPSSSHHQLSQLILKRREERTDALIKSLEEKYANSKKKRKPLHDQHQRKVSSKKQSTC